MMGSVIILVASNLVISNQFATNLVSMTCCRAQLLFLHTKVMRSQIYTAVDNSWFHEWTTTTIIIIMLFKDLSSCSPKS
jgi:hypothetical protein